MKIGLGFKPRYWSSPEVAAPSEKSEKKEPPTCYPSMSIEGDAAKKLIEGGALALGKMVTATIRFRITDLRAGVKKNIEYGGESNDHTNIDIEVQEIGDVKVEKADDDDEEMDAATAVDKFLAETKE